MLREKGFSIENAVWLAVLIGPMQVVGRISEFTIGLCYRTEHVTFFILALLPATLIGFGFAGFAWGMVVVFVVICVLSNGIMAITRGTIPAALFGFEHYGAVNGAFRSCSCIAGARSADRFLCLVLFRKLRCGLLGVGCVRPVGRRQFLLYDAHGGIGAGCCCGLDRNQT